MLGFWVSLGLVKVSSGLVRVMVTFRDSIKPESVKVIYLATPAINYLCYSKRRALCSHRRSCRVLHKFVSFFFTGM